MTCASSGGARPDARRGSTGSAAATTGRRRAACSSPAGGSRWDSASGRPARPAMPPRPARTLRKTSWRRSTASPGSIPRPRSPTTTAARSTCSRTAIPSKSWFDGLTHPGTRFALRNRGNSGTGAQGPDVPRHHLEGGMTMRTMRNLQIACRFQVLCLGAALAAPGICRGEVIASDSASDPAYGDGWQGLNGFVPAEPRSDNGGTGFLPWDFEADEGFWEAGHSPYDVPHFIDTKPTSFNNLGAPAFAITHANVPLI